MQKLTTVIGASLLPHKFCWFLTRSHRPLPLFPGRERGPGPPSRASGAGPRRARHSRARYGRAGKCNSPGRRFKVQNEGLFASPPAGKALPVLKKLVTGTARVGLLTFPPRPVPSLSAPGAQCPPQTRIYVPCGVTESRKLPEEHSALSSGCESRQWSARRGSPNRAASLTPSPPACRSRAFLPAAPKAFGPQELADFAPGGALG